MTLMTKTMRADQLPGSWQQELKLDADTLARVAIERTGVEPTQSEIARMLADLLAIAPVKIDEDVTTFIRAERERRGQMQQEVVS